MRVRGLAFVGLVVGAFMVSSGQVVSASSGSAVQQQQLDRIFSSDGPESVHEAKNQGTRDEPKAWPEANAWLHAQLSDAERDFLALTATGTLSANLDFTGGLSAAQIASTTGSVTVQVRMAIAQATSSYLTLFQQNVVSSITVSSSASVSAATPTLTVVGSALETFISFTFTANGANTAGQQYQAFAQQFAQATSALRVSSSFSNVDLNYFPTAVFNVAPTSAGATTAAPTTVSPTTDGNYCSTHPTACLNGGTCLNGTTSSTFSCSCSSGFIGNVCQFSLFGSNRRASTSAGVARGKSVTRPNAIKPKSA